MRLIKSCVLATAFLAQALLAGEPQTGPVISNYGPVFAVPEGSLNLEQDRQYKIVMDIGQGPDDLSQLNRHIESAARFLNMHARNGIKPENLELAVVLHGSGTRSALSDDSYQAHFDVSNASRALVEELAAAGVVFYVCGQSAGYNGYDAEDLLPQIQMAVSAMTVHVRLQQEGYQAILF